MKPKIHPAVGVIITNPSRDLFYLQQKDEKYWIKEFRMKYCVFGGQIENGEDEKTALKRELEEELEPEACELIFKELKRVNERTFIGVVNRLTKFIIYESVVPTQNLEKVAKLPVKEGKQGRIFKKEDIKNVDFMEDLKESLRPYFSSINVDFSS